MTTKQDEILKVVGLILYPNNYIPWEAMFHQNSHLFVINKIRFMHNLF